MKVDSLHFHFKSNTSAQRYDESTFYREVLQPRDLKAVDIVVVKKQQKPPVCWLVEAKDFRLIRGAPSAKNTASDLPATVELKVRDTIVGLQDMAVDASNPDEKSHAELALRANQKRVVLHLETGPKSKLFPNQPNPANMRQKLKQLLRDIDPNPLVLSINTTPKAGVPWSVS